MQQNVLSWNRFCSCLFSLTNSSTHQILSDSPRHFLPLTQMIEMGLIPHHLQRMAIPTPSFSLYEPQNEILRLYSTATIKWDELSQKLSQIVETQTTIEKERTMLLEQFLTHSHQLSSEQENHLDQIYAQINQTCEKLKETYEWKVVAQTLPRS
jgi:hypothetical protein